MIYSSILATVCSVLMIMEVEYITISIIQYSTVLFIRHYSSLSIIKGYFVVCILYNIIQHTAQCTIMNNMIYLYVL